MNISEISLQETVTGLKLDQALVKRNRVSESVGKIEAAAVMNNTLFVIARKTDNDKSSVDFDKHEAAPLFNNPFNIDERLLSPFEVLLPVMNMDLSHLSIDPSKLIGKYVTVVTKDERATYARYLGELYTPGDYPSALNPEDLTTARHRLNELGKDIGDVPLVKQFLIKHYGYSSSDMEDAFRTTVTDWKDKVVVWSGEGIAYKDIDETKSYELKLDSTNSLKYLNRTPMKTKNCHMFNKIFSGR